MTDSSTLDYKKLFRLRDACDSPADFVERMLQRGEKEELRSAYDQKLLQYHSGSEFASEVLPKLLEARDPALIRSALYAASDTSVVQDYYSLGQIARYGTGDAFRTCLGIIMRSVMTEKFEEFIEEFITYSDDEIFSFNQLGLTEDAMCRQDLQEYSEAAVVFRNNNSFASVKFEDTVVSIQIASAIKDRLVTSPEELVELSSSPARSRFSRKL